MGNLVITIGRELGSGGRTIGKLIAQKLNIAYYDYEIIDAAAKKTGFSADFIKESEQNITHSLLYNIALGTSYGMSIMTNKKESFSLETQIYIAQRDSVKEFAQKSSCVIVGRCADAILKDEGCDLLRVFVYADIDFRADRIISQYGYSPDNAEQELKRADRKRAGHYLTFTGQKWAERENYDLMINSSLFGIEKTADLIIATAKKMYFD